MTLLAQEQDFAVEETDFQNPEWESFVTRCTDDFFCTPLWSRVLDAGYGIKTSIYVLRYQREIVLGIPAAYFDFGWFRLVHAYTPYGEFVGEQQLVPFFLKKLEIFLSRKNIHQIRITRRHYETYPEPNYRVKEDCHQVLDMTEQTESSLWGLYKKNARRDVRIGERAGIKTRILESVEEIDGYYAVYRKTMKRKKAFGPHPRALYHAIQNFLGYDRAIFLGAYHENRFIGGVILIFWKEIAYLLGNVSDPDYHSLCPNDFLIHESLKLALSRGARFFDFMTTGESYKTPSKLSAFKEKWGAVRLPFFVYEKDLSVRATLWNKLWRAVNTPAGSACLRLFFNR